MNYFYLSIIVFTELMMVAMILHVARYKGFTREQKVWYLMTFASIIICSLCEFAVHCGFYDPRYKVILTIITVIQFSIAPLLGLFFTGSLGLHKQTKIVIALGIVSLLVETIAAPFGFIFYFNDEGYFRGNAFIIYEILFFGSLIYLVVGMIVVGTRFKHRDGITIISVIVLVITGIVPMALFKINVTYVAIAVGSILCYVYYNDLVQQDIQQDLRNNQKRISSMQNHIISGLANLIENRDMETGGHITRTSHYVKLLATKACEEGIYQDQIDDHFISLMYTLAPMHDIGKIIISDKILKKPGKLTEEEYTVMKRHAAVGGDVVREVLGGITDEEYLEFASDIATYHHEWWNGTGYPIGLKGEQIPLSSRIMAIADVYDALVSERCYKKPFTKEEALEIISSESGTHFDPKLVEVLIKHNNLFDIDENGNLDE